MAKKRRYGELCLDFCNTVDQRPGFRRGEYGVEGEALSDFEAWSKWARTKALVQARVEGEAAQRSLLGQILSARETIFKVLCACAESRRPEVGDFIALNKLLAKLPKREIVLKQGGFALEFSGGENDPLLPLHLILQDCEELLTSDDLSRLRICAAEECGWLFLDRSKNGTRRWCDMADCGNLDKQRRHYRKKRK